MPLRWEILHAQHFDAIVVAHAMPYAKLFDATGAQPAYDDNDVSLMGARLARDEGLAVGAWSVMLLAPPVVPPSS